MRKKLRYFSTKKKKKSTKHKEDGNAGNDGQKCFRHTDNK